MTKRRPSLPGRRRGDRLPAWPATRIFPSSIWRALRLARPARSERLAPRSTRSAGRPGFSPSPATACPTPRSKRPGRRPRPSSPCRQSASRAPGRPTPAIPTAISRRRRNRSRARAGSRRRRISRKVSTAARRGRRQASSIARRSTSASPRPSGRTLRMVSARPGAPIMPRWKTSRRGSCAHSRSRSICPRISSPRSSRRR